MTPKQKLWVSYLLRKIHLVFYDGPVKYFLKHSVPPRKIFQFYPYLKVPLVAIMLKKKLKKFDGAIYKIKGASKIFGGHDHNIPLFFIYIHFSMYIYLMLIHPMQYMYRFGDNHLIQCIYIFGHNYQITYRSIIYNYVYIHVII